MDQNGVIGWYRTSGIGLNSLIPTTKTNITSFKGKNRPNILLITGWQTSNIGDIAHMPGTLRYLEEYFPEARVFWWVKSFNSEILTMLRQRFPDVALVEGGDLD